MHNDSLCYALDDFWINLAPVINADLVSGSLTGSVMQDIVPKAPKFFIMYKRAGYRVIINHNGDMIVRPSAVEASIHVAGAVHCSAMSAAGLICQTFSLTTGLCWCLARMMPLCPALWCQVLKSQAAVRLRSMLCRYSSLLPPGAPSLEPLLIFYLHLRLYC